MSGKDWNKAYEEGETPWDKGGAHPEMELLQKEGWLEEWKSGQVLCPGAGLGHDVAFLRRAEIEAVGVDISPLAVELSKQSYPDERDLVVLGDFFDGDLKSRFPALVGVWEHTCFCAIPPALRETYVRTVAEILTSGQCLMGVFFICPDMDEGESGPPFGVEFEELKNHFSEFFDFVSHYVPQQTYEGRDERELVVRMRRK